MVFLVQEDIVNVNLLGYTDRGPARKVDRGPVEANCMMCKLSNFNSRALRDMNKSPTSVGNVFE